MFSFFRKKAGKGTAKKDGAAGKDGSTQKDGVAREKDANKKTCQKRANDSEERVENIRQVLQNSSKNTHAGFSESEASVVAIPAANSYAPTHNERKQRNYEESSPCNEPKLEIPEKCRAEPSQIFDSSFDKLSKDTRVNSFTNDTNGNNSQNTTQCLQTINSGTSKQAISLPLYIDPHPNPSIVNTNKCSSNIYYSDQSRGKHSNEKVTTFTPDRNVEPNVCASILNTKCDKSAINKENTLKSVCSDISQKEICESLPPAINVNLQPSPKTIFFTSPSLDCRNDKEIVTHSLVSGGYARKIPQNFNNIPIEGRNIKLCSVEQLNSVNECINSNENIINDIEKGKHNIQNQNIIHVNDLENRSQTCAENINKHKISSKDILVCVSIQENKNKTETPIEQIARKQNYNSLSEISNEIVSNEEECFNEKNIKKENHRDENASRAVVRQDGEKFSKQNRKSKDFYSAFFDTKKKLVDSDNTQQTNKEVINLLLPEDPVSYKKEESYFSKTGVQNFFDKMAGGKGKGRSRSTKNKKKQNAGVNHNGRSWSFNGLKSKESTPKNDLSEMTVNEEGIEENNEINTAGTDSIIGDIKSNSDITDTPTFYSDHKSNVNILRHNDEVNLVEHSEKNAVNLLTRSPLLYSDKKCDTENIIKHEYIGQPVSENSVPQYHSQDQTIEPCLKTISSYVKPIESSGVSVINDNSGNSNNTESDTSTIFECLSNKINTEEVQQNDNDNLNSTVLSVQSIDNTFAEQILLDTSGMNVIESSKQSLTSFMHESNSSQINDSNQLLKCDVKLNPETAATIKSICKQSEGHECIFGDNLPLSTENNNKNSTSTGNVNEEISFYDFNGPVKFKSAEEDSLFESKLKNDSNDGEIENIKKELNGNVCESSKESNIETNSSGIIEGCHDKTDDENIKDLGGENNNDCTFFDQSHKPIAINCFQSLILTNANQDITPIILKDDNDMIINKVSDKILCEPDHTNTRNEYNLAGQPYDESSILEIEKNNIPKTENFDIEKRTCSKENSNENTILLFAPQDESITLNDIPINLLSESISSDEPLSKESKILDSNCNDYSNEFVGIFTKNVPVSIECTVPCVDEHLEFEILTPAENMRFYNSAPSSTEIKERRVEWDINMTSREPSGICANSVDERKEFISGAKIPQYDTKCDSASIKTTHEIIDANENTSATKTAVSNQEAKQNEPAHTKLAHINYYDSIYGGNDAALECASIQIDDPDLLISTSSVRTTETVNPKLTSADFTRELPTLPADNCSASEPMGGADSKQKDKKKNGRGSPTNTMTFETPDKRYARESFSLPPDDLRVAGISKRGSLTSLPEKSKFASSDKKNVYENETDFKSIYLKDDNRTMGQSPGDAVASSADSGVVLDKDYSKSNSFINSSNIKYDVYGNEIKEKMDGSFDEVFSEDSGIKSDTSGEEKVLKHILRDSIVSEDYAEDTERAKKRVTFDTVINFDDGDRINDENLGEDDSAVDSFASFEEIDEDDDDFDIENEEVPIVVLAEHDLTEVGLSKKYPGTNKTVEPLAKLFKSKSLEDVSSVDDFKDARCVIDEVENNENLGLENDDSESGAIEIVEVEDDSSEKSDSIREEIAENLPLDDIFKDIVQEAFKNVIETKKETRDESEDEGSESDGSYEEVEEEEEAEEEEEEEEEEIESLEEEVSEVCSGEESFISEPSESEKLKSSEVEAIRARNEIRINNNWRKEEEIDESAYADMLRIFEKQLRGLADKEGRLSDLQERAAALHRVQGEVCNARKEAELVRQKLRHVEADLAATRSRNCHLLDQLELTADETRAAEKRAEELSTDAMRLREQLDRLLPECEDLRKLANTLSQERDNERKDYELALARERSDREDREKTWRDEFEKLRSQGAESEELLLADCEWKLRDVQKAARDRCARAEERLQELQKAADERCEAADKHLEEMTQLKSTTHDQQRCIRQGAAQLAQLQASQASLQQESTRLRTLLDMEKDALCTQRALHAKELEEKDKRLAIRLEEQAKRLEEEWKAKHEQKEQACLQHAKAIKEAQDKVEILKVTLKKKESQFEESLDKAKTRADWELLEMRRILDKADIKYAEAVERLEESHASETERLTEESEKKVKELETNLSSQACSARATLELVRGQLRAEHAEALQRLKEAHRADMEKQWEMFTDDKEQCLERMKAECMLEGEEDREKRDKQLLSDIEELKSSLASREGDLGSLKSEARKANEARVSAERRLSEAQVTCAARETAARADAARQAETAQREAKETIDHLNKKCVCLSNLFEDMRSRWQQAPGEAAQLRRALQDERARAAALRRQLDAMSRAIVGDGSTAIEGGGHQQNPVKTSGGSPAELTTAADSKDDNAFIKNVAVPSEFTKKKARDEVKKSPVAPQINYVKCDSDISIKEDSGSIVKTKPQCSIKKGVKGQSTVVMNASVEDVKKKVSVQNDSSMNAMVLNVKEIEKIDTNSNIKNDSTKRNITQKGKEKQGYCNFIEANINNVSLNRNKAMKLSLNNKLEANRPGQAEKLKPVVKNNQKQDINISENMTKDALLESNNASRLGLNKIGLGNQPNQKNVNPVDTQTTECIGRLTNDNDNIIMASGEKMNPSQFNVKSNDVLKEDNKITSQKCLIIKGNPLSKSIPKSIDSVNVAKNCTVIKSHLSTISTHEKIDVEPELEPKATATIINPITTNLPDMTDTRVDKNTNIINPIIINDGIKNKSFGGKFLKTFLNPGSSINDAHPKRMVLTGGVRKAASLFDNKDTVKLIPALEKISIEDVKYINLETGPQKWLLDVQKQATKRRGRVTLSPPKDPPVELPQVTVPVRIKQFDPYRNKK